MFKKIFVGLLLALTTQTFSFSYSSFPPITEKNALAISPFIFADDKNSGGMETFFFYGLNEKVDFSISMFTGYGTADFSFTQRYKIGRVITAVRANASWVDPQITWTYTKGKFNTQLSGVSRITFDYPNKPAFFAIIAPYYFLSDKVDICIDITPGYYNQEGDFDGMRAKGFALDIGPCLGLKIGDEAFLVLSVPIYNMQKDPQATFGMGFYYTIK